MSVRELKLIVDDLVSSIMIHENDTKNKNFIFKFCNMIQGMINLASIKIWQINPHPITKFLLRALQDLPNLRQMHFCSPKREDFGKLHRLELISIDVNMPPRLLLRYCRYLTNLRTLHLSDKVSSSNLMSIIELLPYLHELSFYIHRFSRSKLLPCYSEQRNSLVTIFDFLAHKRTLNVLRVKGNIIAYDEAESLANINSLKALDCSFANADLVIYLAQLTSLQILRITYLQPTDISSTYLKVIRQCKDLQFLRIFDYNINPDFVGRVSKVLKDIESKNTLELLIHARHDSLTLRNFHSEALDTNNLLFRSITATELLNLL
ncbi:uncharacterized protein LOC128257958 isoform X1 [Drosophila gunungcola]|uniref:uncharacterized protein LOC128257958 isoform X1 n=2 Tax=Drosophila gunungcola TaxID=103775 RepID=UPI0022E04F1F|nr:uncharacterized protein LOC128257958 isoform X1 [Drosophila gunungcola]